MNELSGELGESDLVNDFVLVSDEHINIKIGTEIGVFCWLVVYSCSKYFFIAVWMMTGHRCFRNGDFCCISRKVSCML